jgi:hypothetical protein
MNERPGERELSEIITLLQELMEEMTGHQVHVAVFVLENLRETKHTIMTRTTLCSSMQLEMTRRVISDWLSQVRPSEDITLQ